MSANRPGVEITQVITESTPTINAPTLVPLVMGVCRQIVEPLDSDGALDSDAKYADAQYNQASMNIPQGSFPDPRDNIDELEFDEASITASLYFGGLLRTLDRGSNDSYGSAFLKLMNICRAASLRSSLSDSFAFGSTGSVLTLAFDVANPANVSEDITVSLVGTLTTAEVVEAINDAVGFIAATSVEISGHDHVQITSQTFGGTSSITLRAGTSALKILFGASFDDSKEYRIEGAGFRGQDDEDSDLTTPWIEFFQGDYYEDDVVVTPFPTVADRVWPGQVDLAATFNTSKAAAVSYTGTSATVPLQAASTTRPGDTFWGDGTQVGSGEVIKVESARFKMGRVNVTLSTYDSDGEITNRVYDTVEVNTEYHSVPFAPKYSYFVAQGLVFGSITPEGEAATLTGTNQGLVERAAMVHGSASITFPANLASLTLIFQVTEDGVAGEEVTHTFVGGPFANASALVSYLSGETDFDQLMITCPGDQLLLQTTKTGADQGISIKSTGTANNALKFSTSVATENTGKDVEFATQAAATGEVFAADFGTAPGAKTLAIFVEDSKGSHNVSGSVTISTPVTLGAHIKAIANAFGANVADPTDLNLYDGGIPFATMSCSGALDTTGTITVTTIEGGADVSMQLIAIDDDDGWRFYGFHDVTGGVSAQIDSDGGISDFVDLSGLWVVVPASGFAIEMTGGAGDNVITAGPGVVDITLTAGTYDANELAIEIETQLLAAAAGPAAAITCTWDPTGHFVIDGIDVTTITFGVHAGTDIKARIFGVAPVIAAPLVTGSGHTEPTLVIEFSHVENGGAPTTVTGSATHAMAAAADAEALAELLNASDTFSGKTAGAKRLVEWFAVGAVLSVRTIEGGIDSQLDVAGAQPGFLAMDFTLPATDIGEAGSISNQNTDVLGADDLKSTTLIFSLDDNPYEYSITFDSNSLQDAIDGINLMVAGSEDVASESVRRLVLASLLAGAASKVDISTDAGCTADTVFGISGSDVGAGRPTPDFYLDGTGSVNIGPNILRNKSSGIPFSLESAYADLYIGYKALRLDVTSSAADPSLLTFDEQATMEDSIGPISTENPLALGTFLAMMNAPTNTVSALGVDEDSAAAPFGTLDGWVRALEFIESKEVYGLAPLTDDEYVQGLIATHVGSMSEPEERGERIVFIWSEIPTRAATITVASGTDGSTNGTEDSFTLDVNPVSELIANGIDPSDEIPVEDNVYLEIVVSQGGSSELRRYSVEEVNGVILTLRTTFAAGENDDGFFTTEVLDEELSAQDWSLRIRGDLLYVTGTTTMDRNAQATAAATMAASYASRRVYYLAFDSIDTSIDGSTVNVPGFYAAAALVGMAAEQKPQQPFTNFPIAGFGRVYGTDDTFSERQMDVIADGGRMLLINLGSAVVPRKQLSTSTTSIETKELSITKAIDWVAKLFRSVNRVFIGRSTITANFLDQLTLVNEGTCDYAESYGAVAKADLTSLLQDTENRDTVLVEITVESVYPCNKIRITIIT